MAGQDVPVMRSELPDLKPALFGADAAVGSRAPGIDTLASEGDRPVALFFLAHWCVHCQEELKTLVELAEGAETSDLEVEIVVVSTLVDPARPNFPPEKWIADEGWVGPTFSDDDSSSAFFAYGGESVPFVIFIDSHGDVDSRHAGSIGRDDLADALAVLADR
ncbi:MAG: TlpA family protein disulfide reductase [Actinomycetia bacterium]|nr:TlpA family protein disulfide reductase [Actinomycetes bacterium]